MELCPEQGTVVLFHAVGGQSCWAECHLAPGKEGGLVKESHGRASYGLLQGFPNPCTATRVGGNRVPSQDGLSQEWRGVLVASADLQRLSGPGFCPGSPGLPDRPWPALCGPGQHEVT